MRLLRRLALLACAGVGAAVLAGPAFGAFARPAGLPNTVGSTHFLVHYQSDLLNNASWAATQTQAGDIAALAERAYAAELADGYTAPPSDGVLGGDGRIDIYIVNLAGTGALGVTEWDTNNPQTSAFILLAGDQPDLGFDQHTIAHELFHVFQLGVWLPAQVSDYWLLEGSAEWMGYRVDGYGSSHPFEFGPSDMSLDCRDPNGTNMCDLNDDYKNNGYSRWPFFEYLSEHYGTSFVQNIFAQGAAGASSAVAALSNALVAKGTTLAAVYNAWTQADLTGAYTVNSLQNATPTTYSTLSTGAKAGALPTVKVPVNHLSTRILEFDRGDNDPTHACYAATLSITVTVPAGTLSQPVFWWSAKGTAPVPLSISGSSAFAAIPWDTCTWASGKGYLALPNASQNVDAADFVVSSTLTVDTTTPVDPNDPPDPVSTNTPVVQVTGGDVAPTLEIAGSEVLRLSPKARQIRLLVVSSGDGKLHAMLGGVDLGSPTLRAGNNDVRFTVPASVLTALRRSAADKVLSLTAVSPQGTQTGTTVTRRVIVVGKLHK